MYAYIDETGNTGKNLFDRSQPDFWIGAMMTQQNFDEASHSEFQKIRDLLGGKELHAAELGYEHIETIAKPLFKLLSTVAARFFFTRIVKCDLAAIKFFDTFFDPGENLALSPHQYNIRPLRSMLLGKVCFLLDEESLQDFWRLMMS